MRSPILNQLGGRLRYSSNVPFKDKQLTLCICLECTLFTYLIHVRVKCIYQLQIFDPQWNVLITLLPCSRGKVIGCVVIMSKKLPYLKTQAPERLVSTTNQSNLAKCCLQCFNQGHKQILLLATVATAIDCLLNAWCMYAICAFCSCALGPMGPNQKGERGSGGKGEGGRGRWERAE